MSEGFGAQSTTEDVLRGVDLRGKRVLVTGTSAGLGIETARALVARGAQVVGTARDPAKGERAASPVRAAAKDGGGFSQVELDLASKGWPDAIIANAGVMACPQGRTADGFETQFGTNHLGHFVFVNRLVPLLKRGARVVNLSSAGHRFADVDLDDPSFERTPYHPFVAYGRSKTANVLYAVGLDRRLAARGVRATAVHPGMIQTELGRHLTPELMAQIAPPGSTPQSMGFKSIPQGAATSVWSGFVAPADDVGGRYCEDCHVAELSNDPTKRGGVQPYALDPKRADALWEKSEAMVGERFSLA